MLLLRQHKTTPTRWYFHPFGRIKLAVGIPSIGCAGRYSAVIKGSKLSGSQSCVYGMDRLLCSKDANGKENFLSFTNDWLCCGSDLQRCARIDSRAGPPAPSERPLIRRPKDPRSQSVRHGSPERSPGFLTQGIWVQDDSSSLPLMERPIGQKFAETAGLAKPMAASHESAAPPSIDWGTFPPLPSVQSDCSDGIRVESLHLISDTLVEPDESPEVSENEKKEQTEQEFGRTRILMASDLCDLRERSKSQQECLRRIQAWFQTCGLENTLVLPNMRLFSESAMSFAECCQPGDTCALILSGMVEIPEEERERDGAPILADFWKVLPRHVTVVVVADHDISWIDEQLDPDKDQKLLVFALSFEDDVSASSRSLLCNMAMLQAADALSLADGPCKLTCLDFFQEMLEQAEDLSEDWGFSRPKAFLKSLPSESLPSETRWPLCRAPQELAREVGANNAAASQTWIRTGAIVSPKLQEMQQLQQYLKERFDAPESHRPRPRSESPPRERQAAAEQLAAAGASIASAALAATAAAVVEAGSATVAALVDVQPRRLRSRSLGGEASQMAFEPPDLELERQREEEKKRERRERKSLRSVESNPKRKSEKPQSLRSMPKNFGSLQLMLSGGGALEKPKLRKSKTMMPTQ